MKQFFWIVFGGLAVILFGMLIASIYRGYKLASHGVGVGTGNKLPAEHTLAEEDMVNSTYDLWLAATTPATSTATARAFIIKDIDKDIVIAEKDSQKILPIASLVKLLTAVIAHERMSADKRVTVTGTALGADGDSAKLKKGETLTVTDLLYPLLMVSSNDAAEALALSYGRKDFIKAMNDLTQSIGAYHTYIADPSGLSPSNVSTAYDLTIILAWIRKNEPALLDITLQKIKTTRSHTWVNPTHMLSWSYYLGGKNGYLPEADRTGASLFKFSSTTSTYAIVVLGSHNRDLDVVSLVRQIKK